MNDQIKNITYSSMGEILDSLLLHSKISHEEYESVKLYGKSCFIIEMIKYIICNYTDITVASLDVTLSEIDSVCKDLYVLILTEENELFVQSAYSGETLLSNEAKFTICQDIVSSQVIHNVSKDGTPVVIGKFIF